MTILKAIQNSEAIRCIFVRIVLTVDLAHPELRPARRLRQMALLHLVICSLVDLRTVRPAPRRLFDVMWLQNSVGPAWVTLACFSRIGLRLASLSAPSCKLRFFTAVRAR